MKKLLVLLSLISILLSCSKDSNHYYNPYLPDVPIQLDINLDWPEYSELRHPGGVHITYIQGIRGVILINTGSTYRAYDAACPNHSIRECSTLQIKKGDIFAKCICPDDGASFNLHLGTSLDSEYQLKNYRVSQSGNRLFISN